MPEKTMEAVFDHGVITGNTITGNFDEARATLAKIEALGISYQEVVALLEQEGVEKFIVSWNELVATVSSALDSSK
jgi:transaldolase